MSTIAASAAHAHDALDPDDLKSLRDRLRKAERRNKQRAFALVLPLLIFISFTFLAPIALMLYRGFADPLIETIMPDTAQVIAGWAPDGDALPPDEVWDEFGKELVAAYQSKDLGKIATRLNYDRGGMRSLVMKSGRKLSRSVKKEGPPDSWREALLDADKRWGDVGAWATIRNAAPAMTTNFYLKAADLRRDVTGEITPEAESRQLYLLTGWDSVWVRTIWISFLVTALCVLLGYPVSFLLASMPLRISSLLMILVLLPFWTSLLVRTTAWIVVLQTQGVLNDLLLLVGVLDERIQLIYNRFGVIVAMVHILLPFMILPIYSVMKTISPSYVRAARSLGATPFTAFWRVYFPQSLPGIGAGALLVFILALGYYITPSLVGGPKDQLVSYFIDFQTRKSLNWGFASALGGMLLLGVLAVYLLYQRLVGIDNMKLG